MSVVRESVSRISARYDTANKNSIARRMVPFGHRLGLLATCDRAVHVMVEINDHADIADLNPRPEDETARASDRNRHLQNRRLRFVPAVLQMF